VTQADITSPRRTRIGVALAVALIHILAIVGLIRAFAPDFPERVAKQVGEVLTVTVMTPSPTPTPEPSPKDTERAGAAGETGKKAVPKEVSAPKPKIVIAEKPAPPVSSTGQADTSGARDTGQGTGAGGQGSGTGSGTGGQGQGAGGGAPLQKIAGEINSARDFPRETRDLRDGSHVIVALTVGTDGRVKGCRIVSPSRDPEADRITCRLAMERFRFRPATDAAGNPVTSIYGWRQEWWVGPRKKSA
jgi:protein TonB